MSLQFFATLPEIEHARWLEQTPKIVFSTMLSQVTWKNTRIVKGSIAEAIINLKQEPGANLLLFGGASIAQTFVKQGLIDEYWLLVNPVVLGSGTPLFQDIKDRIHLKLVQTKTFRSGVVRLHYQADKP